mmetsp:Transcript_19513/g.21822  ORF Transcript_19513/g.21822 Transcript_19513/m.21822 type:complete len:114 (-) Transcript_19513:225-566(-)|eukprot:CAMPEP_0205829558 /NCGR_PEP_ID=MMETSP0206-20130828/38477_1 /ASSEMBLY_ACC=CAM_ASM_000279 /TAXON_ID=36767 /ORGANISM="Euplotes focardii, Strain TN1" /LENGTH=113 /DNA_ID=CAMNT_0053132371 /DNA_START=21 /DNA_END=362 /DNA_ORIENTATION=+
MLARFARSVVNRPSARVLPPAFQVRGFADTSFLSTEVVAPRVVEVVKAFDKVNADAVNTDVKFSDLGLDSLDSVEVVMAFEDEFVIEIGDEDAEKIQSTGDAIKYIVTHPGAV